MQNKYKVIVNKFSGGPLITEEKELARVNGEVEIILAKWSTEEELIAAAKDADVILGGRLFTRRVIESLPKCLAIVTYSVGFDSIEVNAATENGIIVVNNPASAWCVEEVSNHAISLLLACAKKLTWLDSLTKSGRWTEARKILAPMAPVFGQTLGIIGCGNIGRMTAGKARVFGLKVLGNDPYVDKSLTSEYGITLVSLARVLRESDFISLHVPLNDQTRHLIGEAEFKLMRPSAYFINTARGAVVDEAALIKALQQKWIAGAGLDVYEKEPVDPASPLLQMENVIVLPHTGSFSDESVEVQSANPAQEVVRVLNGWWPKNVVNIGVRPKVDLVREE
jgi:D-3-phosphoglycerate dehydrogenase